MITALRLSTILKMNQSPTIKQLRQSGYKVRVLHSRFFKTIQKLDGTLEEVLPKGGYTKIEVTTPDKVLTTIGESLCSKEDLFNRKVGNSIALGRALKQLEDFKTI